MLSLAAANVIPVYPVARPRTLLWVRKAFHSLNGALGVYRLRSSKSLIAVSRLFCVAVAQSSGTPQHQLSAPVIAIRIDTSTTVPD